MLRCALICGLLSIAFTTLLDAQGPVAWHDPSPHTTRFVNVNKDVRLEVLDWGGKGRPVVLLAGGGDTAHVFDEFAPKLTTSYRVYGITRRGFGASSYSPLKDGADSLGEDVLAVIHALKLKKPVLVGHSFGGLEMSSVANLEPKRIAAVIYLDAAYPYAFDNGTGPTMKDFLEIQGRPQDPNPDKSDLASFSALEKWGQAYGLELPESEFRQTFDSTPDGRVKGPHDSPGSQYLMQLVTSTKKYTRIPVPALAIFALPHIDWKDKSTATETYFTKMDLLGDSQAKSFEDGVPGARVIRLRGKHYIFMSNTEAVLREMNAFLASLK